jgi:NAD(P)-dependent dehydrogenase (short-subunit alcohol dehydrogenase family)
MAPRVWLITGASSGFGLQLALLVTKNGDHVIAASRSPEKIQHLTDKGIKVARLNQGEPLYKIKADMANIIYIYGTVDVVVNNAAYVQTGIVEEAPPEVTEKQYQVNTFGVLNVYRAILPHLRAKKSGTLVTIGSMASWFTTPGVNLYNSSKAALRILSFGLAEEVAPIGIKHMLVEPGAFRTELLDPSTNFGAHFGDIPEYKETIAKAVKSLSEDAHGHQPGDPVKGCQTIYDVITSTGLANGRELPALLPIGSDATEYIAKAAQEAIDVCKEWKDVAASSDFPEGT